MTLTAEQQKCWLHSRLPITAEQLCLEHSLQRLCLQHRINPRPTLRFYSGLMNLPAFISLPPYNAILVSDEIVGQISTPAERQAILAHGVAEILCRHGSNNQLLMIDRVATQLMGDAAPLSSLLTHLKRMIPTTIPHRESATGTLTVRLDALEKAPPPAMDALIESLITLHQLRPAMTQVRSR